MSFAGRDPLVTWAEVTWDELSNIMREEFGPKVSQVGQVLQQFGPLRFKKTLEMSVASFAHQWAEQLPECMCPSTADENQQCVDLIRRTLFYYSLDDMYIQKDLCDMDGDPSFKAYFDQAVLSEQKRRSFAEIGKSGSKLDPGGAACLALLDTEQASQAGEMSLNYSGAGYRQSGGHGYRGHKVGRGGSSSYGGDDNAYKGQSGQQQQQPEYGSRTPGQSGHQGHFGGNSDGGRPRKQQYGRGRGGPRGRGGRGQSSTGQIICYRCGKVGHIAAKCQETVVNVANVVQDAADHTMGDDEDPAQMFGAQFCATEVKAVASEQVLPTCNPILTTMKFENSTRVIMECDTAASHNILSQETFQKIWPRGSGPKLSYRKVKIILADGSRSAQETRSMECSVVAANGLRLRLQFFILNGPNNLLGRFALSKI